MIELQRDEIIAILRSRNDSFDTMIRDRIDKHALEKCENINERAWYDAMQNIFLIVICKLIAIYMIIAAENVRPTVHITENIINHPVYSNSTTRTIMVDNSVSTCKKSRRTI